MKKHSQIVQFDSQIVQKWKKTSEFSGQTSVFGLSELERRDTGHLFEDAVEGLV